MNNCDPAQISRDQSGIQMSPYQHVGWDNWYLCNPIMERCQRPPRKSWNFRNARDVMLNVGYINRSNYPSCFIPSMHWKGLLTEWYAEENCPAFCFISFENYNVLTSKVYTIHTMFFLNKCLRDCLGSLFHQYLWKENLNASLDAHIFTVRYQWKSPLLKLCHNLCFASLGLLILESKQIEVTRETKLMCLSYDFWVVCNPTKKTCFPQVDWSSLCNMS